MDLAAYRAKAASALRQMGHEVIGMEDYVASEQRPLATSAFLVALRESRGDRMINRAHLASQVAASLLRQQIKAEN